MHIRISKTITTKSLNLVFWLNIFFVQTWVHISFFVCKCLFSFWVLLNLFSPSLFFFMKIRLYYSLFLFYWDHVFEEIQWPCREETQEALCRGSKAKEQWSLMTAVRVSQLGSGSSCPSQAFINCSPADIWVTQS